MRIETVRLQVATEEGASLSDITSEVNGFVRDSGFRTGLCILTLPGERCCLTLAPDLDESMDDLLRIIRSHLSGTGDASDSAPEEAGSHDRLDVDDSGYAAAGVLADCLSMSIRDGELNLGSWDAVLLLDAGGPRSRPLDVTVMGA